MKNADILIVNGWILTMDPQRQEFNPGYLAIDDPRHFAGKIIPVRAVAAGEPQSHGR